MCVCVRERDGGEGGMGKKGWGEGRVICGLEIRQAGITKHLLSRAGAPA